MGLSGPKIVGCCWLLVVGLGWVGCFGLVGFVALVSRCLHRRNVRNVDVSVIGKAWSGGVCCEARVCLG